jgi:hypothetical protein
MTAGRAADLFAAATTKREFQTIQEEPTVSRRLMTFGAEVVEDYRHLGRSSPGKLPEAATQVPASSLRLRDKCPRR